MPRNPLLDPIESPTPDPVEDPPAEPLEEPTAPGEPGREREPDKKPNPTA
ncbi:MAG: hypothetical protein ABI920_02890 [Casimicrobiaceae bacterium]